jgi:dihydroxyacetone kinase
MDTHTVSYSGVVTVRSDLGYSSGAHVALMINGFGGTPISELYIL